MALDITNGDIFVLGSDEYPIRAVAYWSGKGVTNGFTKMATVTASTKRSPAVSGGKIGAPVTNISSLTCTPLDPVDPELRQRLGLQTPHEVLQVYVPDTDGFYHLVLEELKR